MTLFFDYCSKLYFKFMKLFEPKKQEATEFDCTITYVDSYSKDDRYAYNYNHY